MEEKFSVDLYLTNEMILRETLRQLEKDFESSGASLRDFPITEINFTSLSVFLSDEISVLLHNKNQVLMNLLYRIDLSEEKIKSETKKFPDKDYSLLLAELVLKRELQKVVIREYYKKNKKD